jgi:hypothetical protein
LVVRFLEGNPFAFGASDTVDLVSFEELFIKFATVLGLPAVLAVVYGHDSGSLGTLHRPRGIFYYPNSERTDFATDSHLLRYTVSTALILLHGLAVIIVAMCRPVDCVFGSTMSEFVVLRCFIFVDIVVSLSLFTSGSSSLLLRYWLILLDWFLYFSTFLIAFLP